VGFVLPEEFLVVGEVASILQLEVVQHADSISKTPRTSLPGNVPSRR
jgi:hypothetical protein